jgi:hypothetical protein
MSKIVDNNMSEIVNNNISEIVNNNMSETVDNNIIFSGFLWSPSILLWKTIINELNNSHQIIKYIIYNFDKYTIFENNIINIYKTDDISIDKIKNIKLNSMKKYKYTFLYFEFIINNPKYRIKKNGSIISEVVEHIKLNIRNKYKNKIVNYIHDIIIHISDNSMQTKEIQTIVKTFEKNIVNEFVNLKFFLKNQYNNNIFNRIDLLIRKYSIEQYLNNVKYDFNFYIKMQIRRGQNINNKINIFKNLLESLTNKNYDNNFPIVCFSNYMLCDGSHRLSYLYFKKEKFICIRRLDYIENIQYSRQWFLDNNFTNDEMFILDNELLKLENFLKEN